MAIGRVEGPMLVQALDRQGIDLSFTTNNQPLMYLDFAGNTVTVRGAGGGGQVFTVVGNVLAGNGIILENSATITTFYQNQNLTLQANGSANVTVVRANVTSGQINNTTIGLTTPAAGTFAALNSTRLTTNAGRVVWTDGQGLVDTDDFRYFSSNSTLVAGNVISKSGTIGYGNVSITSNLTVFSSNAQGIAFFNAGQQLVTSNALTFYTANNTVTAGNIRLPNLRTNQITYIDAGGILSDSGTLTFDGLNMTATGISTLGNVQIQNNIIGTTGLYDLYLAPAGRISVQGRNVADVASPVNPNDAVNKQYVDDRTSQSSSSTIGAGVVGGLFNSFVTVADNSLHVANVQMVVDGVQNSTWTSTYANIFSIYINSSTIGTQAGRLILQPGNNDKIQSATNTAFTLPVGSSTTRPTSPDVGDIRYNNGTGTIEWYDGSNWDSPVSSGNTITSQLIYPDGVNTAFTLLRPTTTEATIVSINGVVQQPNQAYSVSGTTITFVEVPLVTDIVEVRTLNTIVAYAVNPIVIDTPYTTIGTVLTVIDQFYISFYRSVHYTYSAKSVSTNSYETGDIYVMHNGITSYVKINRFSSAATLVVFDTVIDTFGILALRAKGASASDTKIKLHRMYFTDS